MLNRDEELVLGIDGGGTKSLLAAATRQGAVTALLRGPGVNPFDGTDWREALGEILTRASGLRPVAVAAGLPGYGEHVDLNAKQEAAIAQAFACPAAVHNDVQMAYDGALGDRPGTLVLSGTGSMAWAQNGADIVRVGGWGHGFGDEGSAYWIGWRAVVLLGHALVGRLEAPGFVRAMLNLIGIADRRDPDKALTAWFYALPHPRPMIAALAQGIDAIAASGDATTLRIFAEAADELSALVRTARQRCPQAGAIWSYAGGSFASPALKAAMTARLGKPMPPALPPIGGALWRAAKLDGWPIDAAWIARLAASLAEFKPASINLHAVDER
ncbi:MAG: N-acetylglucosamine kinase [Alphaproteobacteria bacterium]|nr:N-acetylglucosamine kinase [Alphaproteobacteria bacterium]